MGIDYIGISVSFITVMLGLAYPILLQITIDDKLSSEKILDLFEKDEVYSTFITSLKISIVFVLIYVVGISREVDFIIDFTNNLVSNSAIVLLIISTIVLIWSFFRLTNLIRIFYRPSKLITYLMNKDKVEVNAKSNNYIYFDALSDVLTWSIQNQNILIGKEVSNYFYFRFRNIRDDFDVENKSGLIYPDRFYWLVYNTIQSMLKIESNSLIFLENRTSGSIWLLGEFDAPKISEVTYNWIWRNLFSAINKNRPDLCFLHWKMAHQFIDYNLKLINPDYNYEDDKLVVKNKEEVSQQKNRRERFLEFHYALGGLVLQSGNVELLSKFFNYTTSSPSSYPLLPPHMTQVFSTFFKFLDPYDNHFPWISEKYSFPELESLNDLNLIKHWICKYIGTLYIRQFYLRVNYTFEKPIESPFFPESIREKRLWLNNFNFLINTIKELIKDRDLMNTLNFPIEDNQYLKYLYKIKYELKDDFDKAEINAVLVIDKLQMFYSKSSEILENVFSDYIQIKNENKILNSEEFQTYNIQGTYNITEKEIFTDSGINHLNFDSFQAQFLASHFRKSVAEIFHFNKSKKYLLNQEDVFPAIKMLNLNKNDFVIVCFGVNLDYFINFLKITNLSKTEFDGIPIILLPSNSRIVNNSFFILKKSDLPWFEYIDIDQRFIDLYELKLINKKFKIYASVSDLSINIALRNQIEEEGRYSEKDLLKSVRQGISFRTFLKWKKNMRMVQIQVKDNYDTNNRLDKLDDVISFE
ncbi:hypothetical protein [Lutibacter sp.]|uniref:hypothetical protein n=1 Tax=Lutibacter sp. TaxID=1925666 RepID=UPI003565C2D1